MDKLLTGLGLGIILSSLGYIDFSIGYFLTFAILGCLIFWCGEYIDYKQDKKSKEENK